MVNANDVPQIKLWQAQYYIEDPEYNGDWFDDDDDELEDIPEDYLDETFFPIDEGEESIEEILGIELSEEDEWN